MVANRVFGHPVGAKFIVNDVQVPTPLFSCLNREVNRQGGGPLVDRRAFVQPRKFVGIDLLLHSGFSWGYQLFDWLFKCLHTSLFSLDFESDIWRNAVMQNLILLRTICFAFG